MKAASPVEAKIWLRDERNDRCDHVAANVETTRFVTEQTDSFGLLDRAVLCLACGHEELARRSESLIRCHDCKRDLPERQVYQWTWYDFYAAQGDEPLPICRDCWGKPPHVARRRRDAAERREELGE